jgi:hypothetical protein
MAAAVLVTLSAEGPSVAPSAALAQEAAPLSKAGEALAGAALDTEEEEVAAGEACAQLEEETTGAGEVAALKEELEERREMSEEPTLIVDVEETGSLAAVALEEGRRGPPPGFKTPSPEGGGSPCPRAWFSVETEELMTISTDRGTTTKTLFYH